MSIGVIIGRFQVAELHKGHLKLLEEVVSRSEEVLVLIGVAPVLYTKENPLDYDARKFMVEEYFDTKAIFNYQVLPIIDTQKDSDWSASVDQLISVLYPNKEAILYGSRESFIPFYGGKCKTETIDAVDGQSGTEQRKSLITTPVQTRLQRKALIKGIMNQYPKVHATVDIAIVDNFYCDKVLLGRKKNESAYRFIGGFSDPKDESFESAAKREAFEETCLEISTPMDCLGSFKVPDWRYKNKQDQIITTFFVGSVIGSCGAKASDDIEEVRWFPTKDFHTIPLVATHAKLRNAFLKYLVHKEATHAK